MFKQLFKEIILSSPFLIQKAKDYLIKKGEIVEYKEHVKAIDNADKVYLEEPIDRQLKIGIVKDMVFKGDSKYIYTRSYYPKYERFLRSNNLGYEFYDVTAHDWIEKAKDLDIIIWHTPSDPNTQKVAKSKIYILDKVLGKRCLPSFDEIWGYEDKINAHYLYQCYNLPEIPTFVSHNKEDIMEYISKTRFPIISKLSTGSASFGVEKLNSKREASKLVNQIFSDKGHKTYFAFERQKNYVYFQEFIDDATFDLRIITIGNKAFGYYRFPNKGDFRASGAGNYAKKEIPVEALDLAFNVKKAYGATCLATDLLYSEKNKSYYIIESSIFFGVDTSRQLELNGIAGFYKQECIGNYTFVEGEFWVQELTLKEVIEEFIS